MLLRGSAAGSRTGAGAVQAKPSRKRKAAATADDGSVASPARSSPSSSRKRHHSRGTTLATAPMSLAPLSPLSNSHSTTSSSEDEEVLSILSTLSASFEPQPQPPLPAAGSPPPAYAAPAPFSGTTGGGCNGRASPSPSNSAVSRMSSDDDTRSSTPKPPAFSPVLPSEPSCSTSTSANVGSTSSLANNITSAAAAQLPLSPAAPGSLHAPRHRRKPRAPARLAAVNHASSIDLPVPASTSLAHRRWVCLHFSAPAELPFYSDHEFEQYMFALLALPPVRCASKLAAIESLSIAISLTCLAAAAYSMYNLLVGNGWPFASCSLDLDDSRRASSTKSESDCIATANSSVSCAVARYVHVLRCGALRFDSIPRPHTHGTITFISHFGV